MSEDLLQRVHAELANLSKGLADLSKEVAALRGAVETEIRQHGQRLDNVEPRLARLEQDYAKSKGYTIGVSAAFGLVVTLANAALMLLQ